MNEEALNKAIEKVLKHWQILVGLLGIGVVVVIGILYLKYKGEKKK